MERDSVCSLEQTFCKEWNVEFGNKMLVVIGLTGVKGKGRLITGKSLRGAALFLRLLRFSIISQRRGVAVFIFAAFEGGQLPI